MSILIGGGSGFVGSRLTKLLRSNGYKVTLISRSRGEDKITWGDLSNEGLPEGCTAVVNLAGENLMNPRQRWNDHFKSTLISSRVETSKLLVKCITEAKQKPKVWISASAIGFYPPNKTTVYNEESAGGKGDYFAELCQKCETAASLPPSVDNVRHVVVRIGIALGRDGGTIKQLYLPFFLGLGGKIGSGKQWFPWVHVGDVAGIIQHAIERENISGVLNAVAPSSSTNADFTSAFARALYRPACFTVPGFALKLLYGSERAGIILDGQNVVPKRTLELGYRFLYPDLDSACTEFSRLVNWHNMEK